MPKFKVVNPDAPEEIDFYQDIPLVDPDTGADQLDSEGNILVKRYVNHTVSLKGINEVKNALPAIKTNTQNLEELYQYSHAQNAAQQVAINENANAIVELNTSTSEMALELETLKNKVLSIQGIDIDEVKEDLSLLKQSAYLISGGVLKGDVSIQTPHTATLTLTPTGSSSYASFATNNDVLDCTTTWGKVFKASGEGKFFYGVADKATADVNNKELTSYVADIMGANAQLSIIKGDGTTSVLSINNVLKATNADNATNLGGYPASDYVRSVNGVKAGENGNIELALPFVRNVNNILPDINGSVTLPLPFVKTVNSTAPDSNGNVVLDLSSSGGRIGFPDLSAGVAISSLNGSGNKTYTLPSDGWVIGSLTFSLGNGPRSIMVTIYLNTVLQASIELTDTSIPYSFSVPLKSGTQIKLQSNYGGSYVNVSSTLRLYPCLS